MATKNMSYKKAQLADDDEVLDKFVCDNTGMYFVPDSNMDATMQQVASATHTHRVDETRTPIWNQVTYNITPAVTGNAGTGIFEGHVTLQGITDDGVVNDIMQHYYNADSTTTATQIFDLYESVNRPSVHTYTEATTTAGNVQVEIPLEYQNYEDVELMPSWYDPAWSYRIALPMHMALGKIHNATGHLEDWYTINITVPYKAHMTDTAMTDLRITANDGITKLPFYILSNTAGSYASILVSIPWWYVDKDRQIGRSGTSSSGGLYAYKTPMYIYAYYGNANATSASDITLTDENGVSHMAFYDDFSDNSIDSTKWPTIGTTAHGTITETSAAMQIDLTGGYTESPVVGSKVITDITMGTTPFEMIWIIDEITPKGTVTSSVDMPVFRCYIDGSNFVQCYFPYAAAGVPWGGGPADVYWRYGSTVGGVANTPYSTYKYNGGTTTDRYLKLVHQPSTQTTGGQNAWYVSLDGVHWDFIGINPVTDGPTTGSPTMRFYYQGNAAIAAAKRLRIKGCYAYKTMTRNTYEFFQDHFTNGTGIQPDDRWQLTGMTNSTIVEEAASGSGGSGAPGVNTFTWTNASAHNWTNAITASCPIMYTMNKGLQATIGDELVVYQTKIDAIGTAVANNYAGVFLAEGFTGGTHYALRWGINRDSAGVYTFRREAQSLAGVSVITYTKTPTLPCHMRIVLDPIHHHACFDVSPDGISWERLARDNNIMQSLPRYATGQYTGLFALATTTNSGSARFDYFRAYSGLQAEVDDKTWQAEEAYASFPIHATTPADTDTILTFNYAVLRGGAYILRTKRPGADWINSHYFQITDTDRVSLGPAGTDKYIGMRVKFDMLFGGTDTYKINEINYLYEVI